MAGPVVAWSLDDAATACKHEPRIVREHARKADGMARPAPWPWAQRRVQPPIQRRRVLFLSLLITSCGKKGDPAYNKNVKNFMSTKIEVVL